MSITSPVVDRSTWERAQADHLVHEKAHTRAGDALAAARRRLPLTAVDPVSLPGADGLTTLADIFEGRSQLLAYTFMWHQGRPTAEQCEGCTFSISQISEGTRAYLAERDTTFAVFSEGPWAEISAYRDFMGWSMPWYSTADAQDNPAVDGGGWLRSYVRHGDDVYLANQRRTP
ncbi:DUF899 family protein [Parenemella sanctibonifatiensis]|uniref:DUF899 domain-containing protein n=1 Tax=Parenemella sanctibonifatiensis TaxID=2016505 RepID=A0A255EFD8_9ACTN|nr:DUF899 family protein [Parenemella sanctibonifatiensis]OYN90246.1 hypothetical protein CGZ91_08755 [Parenemella sanctibonifatiensis]